MTRRSFAAVSFALTLACGHVESVGVTDPPLVLDDVAGGWRMIAAGDGHTCGIAKNDRVYCWGKNDRQQVGDGTSTSRSTPTPLPIDRPFATIAAGTYTSCGATLEGETYCWGYVNPGVSEPTLIDTQHRFTQLAISRWKVCGLAVDQAVYCWSTIGSDPTTPTQLPGDLRFRAVTAGLHRVCGVATTADVYCWVDDIAWSESKPERQPLGDAATMVAAALFLPAGDFGHVCAVVLDQRAFCWGWNGLGQLGTGDTLRKSTPITVTGGHRFSNISASLRRTCAVATTGLAYCWGGLETSGQISRTLLPKEMLPNVRVASVSVGEDHTCFVSSGGAGFCMGENGAGQLGTGTSGETNQPIRRVLDP